MVGSTIHTHTTSRLKGWELTDGAFSISSLELGIFSHCPLHCLKGREGWELTGEACSVDYPELEITVPLMPEEAGEGWERTEEVCSINSS